MFELKGNPRKIFKTIFKRYKYNNIISFDELCAIYGSSALVGEDLEYLQDLGLINHDYNWNYTLTTKGRIYFKDETHHSIETILGSILCPIIVSFITTLIALLLKNLL